MEALKRAKEFRRQDIPGDEVSAVGDEVVWSRDVEGGLAWAAESMVDGTTSEGDLETNAVRM